MSGRFTVTTVANPGLIGQSVCKVIMTATLVATAFALAGHASADIYPYTLEGLRQAIEQCTYEANNKWAFEVIKWREQHPPPDSSPYEHERDAQIERCIKKGGWCNWQDSFKIWPSTRIYHFVPRNRVA
jgi:hypothetical protein